MCPHEMTLDVSTWVDAVICDYNYVFDPNAHLRRFLGEGNKGEYLFLIDEAHNLVDRAREMYSASICKEDFLKIKKLVKHEDIKLAKRLDECNKLLLTMKRECENYQILESIAPVYLKLLNLYSELEKFLEECKKEDLRKEVLEFYFDIRMFMYIYECLDDNYMIYSEMEETGQFKIKLFCVNPANMLQQYLDKGNSTIFFSATLLPIHYYKMLLSNEKDNYAIYAESPFDTKKRLLLLGKDVSTKYTRRGETMYRKYAIYLLEMVAAKQGNYLAFFPSYRFMQEVYEEFEILLQSTRTSDSIKNTEYAMQSQYMTETAREIFLENFDEDRDVSFVGFCVLGGVFSEGIDLVEDKLVGAAIVGTGLPQVCTERELLKQHFDKKGYNGFDYAYLYPGMNKVQQAAGRVIRTEEDRGVILLLDERFFDRRYREVFPREWERYGICNVENVGIQIEEFWR